MLALSYMANQLWTDLSQEKKAVIRVLQLILLTKQGSNEAQSMLAAVLNIVAKPLEHALRLSQRQNPKSQEIEPLLRAIKDNIRYSRRTAGAGHNELEAWTSGSTANGGAGLAAAIRHTVQGFIQWSLHPAINIMPTAYTHRQVLAALRLLGARRLLHVILDELKLQTDAGSGSVAYDVATALVCAPDATNQLPPDLSSMLHHHHHHQHSHAHEMPPPPPQTHLSLHAALRFEAEDFKALQKQDPTTAENVVRLYRRVEAQLLEPPPPPPASTAAALGLVGAGDDADVAAAAAAEAELNSALEAAAAMGAAGAGDDGSVTGGMHLDLSGVGVGGGGGADSSAGGAGSAGGLDDDIFGGLGSGADLLDWEGMLQ